MLTEIVTFILFVIFFYVIEVPNNHSNQKSIVAEIKVTKTFSDNNYIDQKAKWS